ncbi:hypothetical protein RHMOL_Rhmol08G0244800 [Rhododendron molle]|uniref:Uncharacterized protein n=1 Tax=Rhododendron molle TaxID=49168 RepID=A0ACC0MTY8_RHOML|nr:hypothetical protein RHMOL_Rhmol08G0244800 [Rhododendron molle]
MGPHCSFVNGTNFALSEPTGFPDPYVVFTCNGRTRTSSVKLQTLDPQWNCTIFTSVLFFKVPFIDLYIYHAEILEFDAAEEPPSVLDVEGQFFGGKFRLSPPSVAGGGLDPGVVASFRTRGNCDEFGASILPDYAPACSTDLLLTAALWPPSLSSLCSLPLYGSGPPPLLQGTASPPLSVSVYGQGRAFRVGDCLCLCARMVVDAPFVRWDIIRHDSAGSTRAGVYYLETAQGDRVVCAVAIPCEGNRMTYRPYDSFLEDYRAVLPSARVLEWNFRFQLAKWLDGILYYSFLQYSEEALRTSCLPSCISSEGTVLQFGHLHLPIVQLRLDFEVRLKEAFQEFDLEEMVIKMGHRVWNVPINDLQLDAEVFDEFLDALDLSYLDFLLVLMLPTLEFQVVVFPMDYDVDRIYSRC